MNLDWSSLRAIGGSQEHGFEEFCSQLARRERPEQGGSFVRKGTPDAGVECFWKLPDGSEVCWQAKFFRDRFSDTQVRQLDESFRNALDKHPEMTRFIVCLPMNLPDGRVRNQKSARRRYDDWVAECTNFASIANRNVEIELWDETELTARITAPQMRGAQWFWFENVVSLTSKWFHSQVEVAVANIGERYSPELNVEVAVRSVLDGLANGDDVEQRLLRVAAEVADAAGWLYGRNDEAFDDSIDSLRERSVAIAKSIEALASDFAQVRELADRKNVAKDADALASEADKTRLKIFDVLDERSNHNKTNRASSNDGQSSGEPLRSLAMRLSKLSEQLWECNELLNSDVIEAADVGTVVLRGEAGQGKSHLFADFAIEGVESGHPRVLLTGDQFFGGNVWKQIVDAVGLNCDVDIFLGALSSAAQASGKPAVILVDAINEGQNNEIWRSQLRGVIQRVKDEPWIRLAFSIRDTYVEAVLPDGGIHDLATVVVHRGFHGLEAVATTTFFDHFGITPSFPPILTEYRNPLFLKLLCQAMSRSGQTVLDHGVRGISAISELVIDSVDQDLARRLDYEPRKRAVRRAVHAVAREMNRNKRDFLTLDEAESVIDPILPTHGFTKSLRAALSHEGLITQDESYSWEAKSWVESIRFTYQRVGDHIRASEILEGFDASDDLQVAFAEGGRIATALRHDGGAGLLEALAVLVPERFGYELVELKKCDAIAWQMLPEFFLKSLAWRSSESIGEAARDYLRELFNNPPPRQPGLRNEIWDALIAVSPVPGHPLNADRLHDILEPLSVAERDEVWTIPSYSALDEETATGSLVRWGWREELQSPWPDEVRRLAAIAISWFLTSSNRYLRDHATKALVGIVSDSPGVVRELLSKFTAINDPYVAERVYAAAYAAVLRTNDEAMIAAVADEVVTQFFGDPESLPQAHITTRGFADGIVAFAHARGLLADEKFESTQGVFRLKMPSKRPFSLKTISKRLRKGVRTAGDGFAAEQLMQSMTTDMEDFKKYVIGSMDEWTSLSLTDEPPTPRRVRVDDFVNSLTERQRAAFNDVRLTKEPVARTHLENQTEFTPDEWDAACKQIESKFLKTLGRKKRETYENDIQSIMTETWREDHPFDIEWGKRVMLQRIVELGWTAERFGSFDWHLPRHGRDDHKPERIGKKYQWIAYGELRGRLAENVWMKQLWGRWCHTYQDAVDIRRSRDIDPTMLLTEDYADYVPSWWFSLAYDTRDELPVDEWSRRSSDIPDPSPCLLVTDDAGDEWIALTSSLKWQAKRDLSEGHWERTYRDMWIGTEGYLVRADDAVDFEVWGVKQNFFGRWMPEGKDTYSFLLGELAREHPWIEVDRNRGEEPEWTCGDSYEATIPVKVHPIACRYICESGFDCSLDESVAMHLPGSVLRKEAGWHWSGKASDFLDDSGQLVAFDPSTREPGPSTLLVRRSSFDEFLTRQGYAFFLTVLGERMAYGQQLQHENHPGWTEVTGLYRYDNGGFSGKLRSTFKMPGDG